MELFGFDWLVLRSMLILSRPVVFFQVIKCLSFSVYKGSFGLRYGVVQKDDGFEAVLERHVTLRQGCIPVLYGF